MFQNQIKKKFFFDEIENINEYKNKTENQHLSFEL